MSIGPEIVSCEDCVYWDGEDNPFGLCRLHPSNAPETQRQWGCGQGRMSASMGTRNQGAIVQLLPANGHAAANALYADEDALDDEGHPTIHKVPVAAWALTSTGDLVGLMVTDIGLEDVDCSNFKGFESTDVGQESSNIVYKLTRTPHD